MPLHRGLWCKQAYILQATKREKQKVDVSKRYSMELFQEQAKDGHRGKVDDQSSDRHYNPSSQDPEAGRSPTPSGSIMPYLGTDP